MSPTDQAAPRDAPRRAFFRSIRTRLAVSFSLLFVTVLVIVELLGLRGVPFSAYRGRIGDRKSEAFRSLNLVADLKKERLLRWLEERRDDILVSAENRLVAREVGRLREQIRNLVGGVGDDSMTHATELNAEAWAEIRNGKSYAVLVEFLKSIRDAYGVYDRIQVADAETGTIIVSTEDADLGADASHFAHFADALRVSDAGVSDVETHEDRSPTFHIGHVIRLEADRAIAVLLLLEVSVEDIVKSMLHTGGGLGRTGEALLVNRDVRILTSPRHSLPDGTSAKPLDYQIRAEPAALAAAGEEGIIEAKDYRGEPVLAAYRHIRVTPEFGWGMVVKQDKAELFAPMRMDVTRTALTGLIGVAVVVALTSVLVRRLTGPIVSLGRTAERVTEGDLEARAPVTSTDEVGTLATTFNSMIERIQNRRRELEEAVTARTAELNQANVELKAEATERKRAEQAALAAQKQLLEQQRSETQRIQAELEKAREKLVTHTRLASIGQVAASIAHELRNPLGAARNATYYLKRYVTHSESDLTEHLQIIDEEINTANRIITDLMNMTRSRPPRKQKVDFLLLAQEALERTKLGDGVRCRFTVDPDPFTFDADPGQLQQVIGNLLANASQAIEGDGEIVVEARKDAGCSEIMISDNGRGVAMEHLDRLFEPLFTTKAKGTGLGLTICREIVERHGGTIELVDREEPGTAFCIRIPG